MSNHVCICAFIIYNIKLYIIIYIYIILPYIALYMCVLSYIYITLYVTYIYIFIYIYYLFIYRLHEYCNIYIYCIISYVYNYICVCVTHISFILIIYQICACNLLTSKHSWNMIPRSHASRKSPCRSTGCKRLQSRNGCLSSPLKSWLPCSARHCALQNHSCCRGKLLSIDMIITYNYILNKQRN